jgi:hypothetical protein
MKLGHCAIIGKNIPFLMGVHYVLTWQFKAPSDVKVGSFASITIHLFLQKLKKAY